MGIMEYGKLSILEVTEASINQFKGYLWSEKIDGWHVVWDGKDRLYTKGGNLLPAPDSFKKLLPQGTAISGELIVKRQQATKVAELTNADR